MAKNLTAIHFSDGEVYETNAEGPPTLAPFAYVKTGNVTMFFNNIGQINGLQFALFEAKNKLEAKNKED